MCLKYRIPCKWWFVCIDSKKVGNMNGGGQVQGGPGMPDPINALQTLATQGTRNNQMMGMGPGPQGPPITASNLLQTLNQRPGQVMQGNMPGQMPVMQGNMPMQNKMMTSGPMPGQMQQGMPMQQPQMMQNQMPQMQGMQPQMNPMMNQMHMQRKPDQMMMNPNAVGFQQGPRNVTPNPYLRQSPTDSVHSPAGLQAPPSNQMIPSPALVPSPSSQVMSQRSCGMAPSPGSSLNTPGQAVPAPSPLGMPEDQVYRDKVRQLSKYIEPLRKMIARMGNEGEASEKASKMKNLLELLSNPTKRMPLETILKCQVVLERMDLKRSEGGSVGPTTQLAALKEHHIFNPLLEAISNCLQSTVFNHTLQRTFGPSTEALNGPEIK